MDIIYLEGELAFCIIQCNLLIYILPHSVFENLSKLCLSIALESVLQITIKISKMPDSVIIINIKEAPWNIYKIGPMHLDCKGTKVYAADGTLN